MFDFFRDLYLERSGLDLEKVEEERKKKKKKDSIKKNKKYDKVIICNKKYILSDNSANVSALYKKMSFLGRLFRTISF